MSDQEQQKAVDEILARFPGPASIYPNRSRLIGMLAIMLVTLLAFSLVVFGLTPRKLWMWNVDALISVFVMLLWMTGLIRMLVTNRPILILDQKGITSNRILGWQQTADWKHVESCGIDDWVGANVLVNARDQSPYRFPKIIKVSWFIEPNYDPLVRLVTQWRERALQAKG